MTVKKKISSLFNLISKADVSNFRTDFEKFNKLDLDRRFSISWKDRFPCLNDRTNDTPIDAHYIYHPAWAIRAVKIIQPLKHIDISSILHFSTLLSAFVPTEFYDFRPAKLNLSNLICGTVDLNNLTFESDSIESISCMHTVEHIGLGRYGDQLDPEGDVKAINELKRVCKPGGHILFVVPVGKPLLRFNAHRIYSAQMITTYFSEFDLLDFSLVTDSGDFLSPCELKVADEQVYGCGCFWFKKAE